jgi:hypothetical protein
LDGSNLVVMGLPKKTFTMLDMMHFVPKSFARNVGKSAPEATSGSGSPISR